MSKILVKNILADHADVLYKLDRAGIKCLSTALDYLVIYNTFEMYHKIEKLKDRKMETAERCKVSLRTVELALSILGSEI